MASAQAWVREVQESEPRCAVCLVCTKADLWLEDAASYRSVARGYESDSSSGAFSFGGRPNRTR